MKDFIIIGGYNAITYSYVYPLIKDGLYYTHKYFKIKTCDNIAAVRWYSNLYRIPDNVGTIPLVKSYNPEDYPKYDNYDAIDVQSVFDIPYDYDGVMGVPVNFFNRYNPDQFEIVRFRYGDDNKDLSINGIHPYFRILIKRI